jgi:hypothetical protein
VNSDAINLAGYATSAWQAGVTEFRSSPLLTMDTCSHNISYDGDRSCPTTFVDPDQIPVYCTNIWNREKAYSFARERCPRAAGERSSRVAELHRYSDLILGIFPWPAEEISDPQWRRRLLQK